MDHKAFLKALSREDAARLTRRSDRAGLFHLAGHLGMILLFGGLIAARVPGWFLLLPLQGICIVFLFTLEHETTHQTPFRSRWLNEAVGHGAGFLILLPFQWFRYFHLAHHKHTNDPLRDPELLEGGAPVGGWGYCWHVSGLPYWIGMLRQIWVNARGRARADYLPASVLPRLRREARWMLVGYALALATLYWSPVSFWVWGVPLLLGQPFLRLYLLAEHGRCPEVHNMFENTRTVLTTRALRFLAWNMPYHTEHHVHPQVPFHALPEFHALTAAHLANRAPGYAAFTRDYVREIADPGR